MIHRSSWRPSLSKSLELAKASSKCNGTTCDPFIALLGPRTCLTLWYSSTAVGSEHVIRIYKFQITAVVRGWCQEPEVVLNCVCSVVMVRINSVIPQLMSCPRVQRAGTRRAIRNLGVEGDSRVLGEQNLQDHLCSLSSFSGV